jgi:hypothetical protein
MKNHSIQFRLCWTSFEIKLWTIEIISKHYIMWNNTGPNFIYFSTRSCLSLGQIALIKYLQFSFTLASSNSVVRKLFLKKLTCKGTLRKVVIRVYRLEIANFLCTVSHVGIFDPASTVAPLTISLVQLSIPLPPHSINRQCVAGREWVVLSPVGDHILQEF